MKSIQASRRWHRKLVALIAMPLLLTIISGSIFAILKPMGIYPLWLIRIHTGNFGIINLQPIYSPVLGILTLLALATGLTLLRRPQKQNASKY
jgi:hypothetical protein